MCYDEIWRCGNENCIIDRIQYMMCYFTYQTDNERTLRVKMHPQVVIYDVNGTSFSIHVCIWNHTLFLVCSIPYFLRLFYDEPTDTYYSTLLLLLDCHVLGEINTILNWIELLFYDIAMESPIQDGSAHQVSFCFCVIWTGSNFMLKTFFCD